MSNSTHSKAVTVHILDKEYLVSCSEAEQHDLIRSADFLDQKMREIRDNGKIIGSDRIAVMAALNISHELLAQDGSQEKVDHNVTLRLKNIQDKIEDTLYKSQQLEF
ncbi:MAG: cell division protein ZapA [Gammaproteobacteria bacterium]|nr:cell division protein ZapA [Gammaproteobacteria bacterium]